MAPLKIIAYREGLYALCRLLRALREPDKEFYDPLLAIHRMHSVRLTDEHFRCDTSEIPAGPTTFGVMPGHPFRVTVAFSAKVAPMSSSESGVETNP